MKLILFFVIFTTCVNGDVYLVYGGKRGWIGQKIVELLQQEKHQVHAAEARLENREEITREIESIKPDFIINAAGVTGRPNVDWCEDHQQETIRANVIGTLNLIDVAYIHGIHVTNVGTGCIYQYDAEHPMYSGVGFTEEEKPNFFGSFYSRTKGMMDQLMMSYSNVLNLRLRMPISSDLHLRNFITKITQYKKVVNIPNSMSILDDLLPVLIKMSQKKLTGNYNFVNPGTISHNEILALYKAYIDPSFVWENFSLEEQDAVLKAGRSNNELDASKLLEEFPVPPIQQSIIKVFERMKR